MKQSLLQRVVRRAAVLTAGLGLAVLAHAQSYTGLFVFGDSLSDTGNDLIVTSGLLPTASYYTNADNTVTGRFTNGRSYVDYLAAGLGLSLAPSMAPGGGTNYAYGGARTSYVNSGLTGLALSFNEQVSAFGASHATADPHALYVLWIGANDMSDAISLAAAGDSTAFSAAITNAMGGISNAIQDLASRGATHFLIPNLPDLSLVPSVTSVGSPGLSFLARTASTRFNDALSSTLGAYSALDIHTLNVFALQTDITNNPSAYGLTNVSEACYSGDVTGAPRSGPTVSVCANPAEYLYWDYEHPTEALHAVLGAQALAEVTAVPEPSQWLLMVLGVVVLVSLRRGRHPASLHR